MNESARCWSCEAKVGGEEETNDLANKYIYHNGFRIGSTNYLCNMDTVALKGGVGFVCGE